MTTTVEAIYEGGKLILPQPLPLPEKAHVMVTIDTELPETTADRAEWLKLSEQSLLKAWNNPADDIFNDLLAK